MASLSGYIALILFILSFFLAARIPLLNRMFNELRSQLRVHHWIALMAVVAMILHLSQLLWSNKQHVELLFDWRDIGLLSGWITFVGVMLSLPFAFYRVQIPYRKWRVIHHVTTFCLITVLFHTLLLFSPQNFKEYMLFLLLTAFGLIGLMVSVILPAFSFWGKEYLIASVFEIRPKLFLLQLKPKEQHQVSQHFHFDPGHFIYLKFFSHGFSQIWHPFTIISKPVDSYIELFVKARGRDTNQLNALTVPAPVRVLAPFGTTFWKQDQKQLWIAYGVGAAVFLAAIRSFPSTFCQKIHFIFCDSSLSRIFFKEELDNWMQKKLNFTWEYYIGTGQQFIAEFSKRPLDSLGFDKVRICGHPGFQRSLRSLLISLGIQKQNIQLEGLF